MPPPAPPLLRQLLRPQQCRRDRSPRFFRPEQTSSTPVAPPAPAPAVAAAESTAAAAGTATGANMAPTALAQQPVADSLAAAFREGIAITPPAIPHPSSVRQQYDSLQAVLPHPFLSHPSLPHPIRPPVGVRECCNTPWFITSPSWPLRAALYHPGYVRCHTPHSVPHPVIYFSPKTSSPGCDFLCSIRVGRLE